MANRYWNEPSMQLEQDVVRLYAHVTFGASGAPTLDAKNSKGFIGVTKDATGQFTLQTGQTQASGINVVDTFFKVIAINPFWDASGNSGTAPAAPLVFLTSSAIGSDGKIQLETTNMLQAATNPAAGEGLYLELQVCNSNNSH